MTAETELQHPEWMTEEAIQTLANGYLHPGETIRDTWSRVATTAAKILDKPEITSDLFDTMWNGWLGLASPVLSNFGVSRGLPISCYSIHVNDDLGSIFSHIKESSALSRNGGGVGIYLGDIRHSGSKFGDNGVSSGVAPWSRLFDETAQSVSQGGVRRGSFALYLPIDHPDVPEMLRAKDQSKGDPRSFIDSNLGLTITDKWLEEMLSGDRSKLDLFGEVLKSRMTTGSPYLVFIDNVNRANPPCYKERGLKVSTSNLCFTSDTLVKVDGLNTPIEIRNLIGADFKVPTAESDGKCFRDSEPKKAVAFKTGTEEVVKVVLSDGSSFKCTPTHKLGSTDGWWVEAKDSLHEKLRSINSPEGLEVISLEPAGIEDVYDLTVADNHNFFIMTGKGDGVLVHNCSEITLHTDENHTFVCCLSSLNLAKYNEWCDWVGPESGLTAVELSVYLLEAVMTEFIRKSQGKWGMGRARRFAEKSRALGLGVLGYHHYLQSLGLPFESEKAREVNVAIHRQIKEEAAGASQKLAQEYGEPEWCRGSGMRHTHLLAIAPTKTNSVICGSSSQGVEPQDSNYFVAAQAKGSFVRKNPILKELLSSRGEDTEENWDSVLKDNGSVKNLTCLTKEEKNIFKTAREINQKEIIRQACDRQEFICQAQSLNLFVDPNISAKELIEIHLSGWKRGLKSLYYLKSSSPLKVVNRYIVTREGCPYCDKMKQSFRERNLSYTELTKSEAQRKGMWKESHGTFPQLWEDGEFKGGYSDNECKACEA